jgi:CobQ-like glutamine amidotransferase family enzyme
VSSWFTIARLLPQTLGINGSSQNALILEKTLSNMGHQVSVVDINDPADLVSTVDVVCVGSGSGSSVKPAATQLIGLVRALTEWRNAGAYFFAVGVGWDLLGSHLVLSHDETLPGVGIFPSHATHEVPRFAGEVSGIDYQGRPSAGYVNQVGASTLDSGVSPLVSITRSAKPWEGHEGLVSDGLMATRLGGPALSLNPHWALDIAQSMMASRGQTAHPTAFHDRVERLAISARALIDQRLGV